MSKLFEYACNRNIDMGILRILNSNLHYASGKGAVTYIENHENGYGAFPDKDVVIYHRFGQGNDHFEKFIGELQL